METNVIKFMGTCFNYTRSINGDIMIYSDRVEFVPYKMFLMGKPNDTIVQIKDIKEIRSKSGVFPRSELVLTNSNVISFYIPDKTERSTFVQAIQERMV
ncbi:MAG: hypothetical protein J6W42_00180 [Bacteroidaceae bacterium]|nr:hypothetical protein [Bacteroidaceae bacterium]